MYTEFALAHRERLKKAGQFQAIFNCPLPPYLDPFTGFDVVRFDQDIGTPDGISTSDYIISKYGAKAEKLIMDLI